MGIPFTSPIVFVFEGRWGRETVGSRAERSISTVSSYSASGSASKTVKSRSTRPFSYSRVFSSTGKIPFFAPASIAIFAMAKRSSMERELTPSP